MRLLHAQTIRTKNWWHNVYNVVQRILYKILKIDLWHWLICTVYCICTLWSSDQKHENGSCFILINVSSYPQVPLRSYHGNFEVKISNEAFCKMVKFCQPWLILERKQVWEIFLGHPVRSSIPIQKIMIEMVWKFLLTSVISSLPLLSFLQRCAGLRLQNTIFVKLTGSSFKKSFTM